MPKFQILQGFALNVIFQLHLVTAAAYDSCGCTVGKDFSDLNVQPGLSVSQFASGKLSSFSSLFGEGLGGKRTHRGLTLFVILLSGNLNFAYTGIWGMNRKCPTTQQVQEQCWNSAMPLTSSKHVFLCKIGIPTSSRVVKRMHISKVHWNCGRFWI